MFDAMMDDAQDEGMGWEAQMENEARRYEEDFDWQAELDNDPEYIAWLNSMADMELERHGNGNY